MLKNKNIICKIMAINTRKISSFPSLTSLTGSEYVMASYNNKSYKIPVSMLIGTVINSITQTVNKGDGANNPVTITLNDGTSKVFQVRNGAKGSQGDKGPDGDKGAKGDSGVALYNTDVADLILDSLSNNNLSDEKLATMILSATQGITLYNMLDELREKYLDTQQEYDDLVAENKIDEKTKYLIFEE